MRSLKAQSDRDGLAAILDENHKRIQKAEEWSWKSKLKRLESLYFQPSDIPFRGEYIVPEKAQPTKHTPIEREIQNIFNHYRNLWLRDTSHLSSITMKSMHPAYQYIIGLGNSVIPIMLRELEREPGHWFWALHHITRENPVKAANAGIIDAMAEDWLEWGREKGYI